MYAVFSTLYTRNQDGTCTKQSQVAEDYFDNYLAALIYLGDERVVRVYLHEVEVLTIEEVR